ncbi:MAG: hypothetical protein E7430_09965 [Ruminococcaceae bacterium]|nr:hypothetical protein [Oscillospiraceae bacterium]
MKVCFNGIGQQVVTFMDAGSVKGQVCKVSDGGTVAACADGDVFAGVVVYTDGSWADVQLKGYVTVPYTGTAPAPGWCDMVGNGSGGVAVEDGGRSCLVVEVDTTAGTVGMFI